GHYLGSPSSRPEPVGQRTMASSNNARRSAMARTIIVHAAEPVACPKCDHRFPLTEGLSRQAIERHAGEYERALAAGRKELEARLAAEARAQYEIQAKALADSLGVKDRLLARFRDE